MWTVYGVEKAEKPNFFPTFTKTKKSMDFKDWKIKVGFHEMEFESIKDERNEKMLMEASIKHLVSEYNFVPRQGDLIHDMEGFEEDNPFEILAVAINIHSKTLEFHLSTPSEDED
jgi:hypothetical protein